MTVLPRRLELFVRLRRSRFLRLLRLQGPVLPLRLLRLLVLVRYLRRLWLLRSGLPMRLRCMRSLLLHVRL